ncbi:MAG: hypothetical protein IPL36_06480 [Nigerium sp.]|nr:hypothetical protein [Nigerium sp.]
MTDLADRISRAAVAALDLAPFDDRYASLSRQVLAGGASRFTRVIASDEAVHYVIPVGLVSERVAYGALVLQDHRAGVLWRDADGLDRATVVARDEAMSATFAPVVLGSQEWMRFEVAAGSGTLSFLAPPVAGSLLDRTLIDFFQATAGARPAADVVITTGDDPETTAVQPAIDEATSSPGPDASAAPGGEPEPDTATEPVVADPDATAVYAPFADEGAGHTDPVVPDAGAARSSATVQNTSVHEPGPLETQPFGLYRDEAPAAPPTEHLPVVAATPVLVTPMGVAAEVTEAVQPGMSRTTAGFLIGFFGILLIGGLAIAVRLLGS